MPRKMSGSEISTIEASIVAISTPRVVFDSVDHLPLYGSAAPLAGAGAVALERGLRAMLIGWLPPSRIGRLSRVQLAGHALPGRRAGHRAGRRRRASP